jgi:hypothetical protein
LCAKAGNSTSGFGCRADVALFRDIEKHKDRIEEDVEQACRLDEAGTKDTGPRHTEIENSTLRFNTTQINKDTGIAALGSQDRIVRQNSRNLSSDILKLSGKVTQPDPIPNNITSPYVSGPDILCKPEEPAISQKTFRGKRDAVTAFCNSPSPEEPNLSTHTPNQKVDNISGVRYRTRSALTKVPTMSEEFRDKQVRFEGGEFFVRVGEGM